MCSKFDNFGRNGLFVGVGLQADNKCGAFRSYNACLVGLADWI